MLEAIAEYFSSQSFMPHGHCYLWRPDILWMNVAADAIIALSYMSIPLSLIVFVRRRSDLRFNWLFWLFAAFILLCGFTHIVEIWTTWHPNYGFQGLLKMATGLVSLGTAAAMWPLLPLALRVPSFAAHNDLTLKLKLEVAARTEEALLLRAMIEAQREVNEAGLDIERCIHLLLSQLKTLLAVDGVAYAVVDGDRVRYTAVSGSLANYNGHSFELRGSLAGYCAVTDSIVSCEDTETDDRVDLEACRRMAIRAMILAPIRRNGEVVGVVKAVMSQPRAFEEKERRVLDFVAGLNESALARAYAFQAGEDSQKKAVAELAIKEAQFQQLANSLSQLCWMAHGDGYIFWYNERWYDFTGTNLAEMEGSGWQKVHHPDHIDRIVDLSKELWARGEAFKLTFPLRSRTGEYRWFLTKAEPLKDESGKVVRWFGTNTDITSERESLAEKEKFLREIDFERQRFEIVMKQMPAAIVVAEAPSGKLIFANEKFRDVWRIEFNPVEDIEGYRSYQAFHADGRAYEPMDWPLARSIANGEIVTDEMSEVLLGNGMRGTLRFNSAPVRDRDGTIVAGVVISQDVTEQINMERTLAKRSEDLEREIEQRRRAEFALQENQARLELALNSANMGTWELDLKTGLARLSTEAARIIGTESSEQSVDQLLAEIVHPDDAQEVDRLWRSSVESGRPYSQEFRIVRASGDTRWLLSRGKFHEARNGRKLFSGIVADVTERKLSEDALHISEARFRNAVKATNDAIWDWDLVTNEVAWNDALYSAFGFDEGTVGTSAQWWLDRIHPDDRLRVEHSLHAAIEGGAAHWSDRYRFLRADGGYAPVLDRGYIVRSEKGNSQRMIGAMQDLTALAALNDRIEENQRRFERVLQSVDVGLWYCDLPFAELIWDARVKAHFWLPEDATVTIETFYDRIHSEDRLRTKEAIDRSIENRSNYDIEYRTCNPDEIGIKWIRAIGSTSYDAEGGPIRFDGLTLDITAEKESERALVDKQRHLSLALAAGRLGSWDIDLKTGRGQISGSLGAILGVSSHELEGVATFFFDFTHVDDREQSQLKFDEALNRGADGIDLEYRIVTRKGEIRWLSSHMLILKDENQTANRIFGVSIDITERKSYELTLAASEERFRGLASAVPQIVWTMTPGGQTEYFNDRWFVYTGHARDEVERPGNAIHPDDIARILADSASTLLEKRTWVSEYRLRRHDGEYRWHLARRVPIRNLEGEIIRWVGSATDIHDQKRFAELLELQVKERTAALTAANKELEAFSYSVSHDLRAPLRGIDGFSRMLETRYGHLLPQQGLEFIQRTRAAASRMGVLIDDMLQLSRLTRREMRVDRINLSVMVEEIAFELRTKDHHRSADFDIEQGVVAIADPSLIRAALENLIGNAWKFTGNRSKTIIRFGIQIIENEGVYFISDNGAGFDMAYSKKLFGAFARLHGDDEFEGTGIGLASVQRVINRHGGRVWAEGTVDQGATFYFTLARASFEVIEKESASDVQRG